MNPKPVPAPDRSVIVSGLVAFGTLALIAAEVLRRPFRRMRPASPPSPRYLGVLNRPRPTLGSDRDFDYCWKCRSFHINGKKVAGICLATGDQVHDRVCHGCK